MKAQIKPVFIFLFALIVIAFILIFSFQQIRNLDFKREQIEFLKSFDTLKTNIKEQQYKSYGTITEKTISFPQSISRICFIDNETEFNEFINNELNQDIKVYSDKNLFLYPSKFKPENIKDFMLDQSPLCIKLIDGKLSLKLTNAGNKTKIEAKNENLKLIDCVDIVVKGHEDEKVDIVFLGHGYEQENFAQDVNYYIHLLSETEPFRSGVDKLNFYRVDSFDIDCNFDNGYIECDDYDIKSTASNCPNDYIFVLSERNKIIDMIKPIRSSALPGIGVAKINTADNKLVLMHEFGHLFGHLADEYTDIYYEAWFEPDEYPNCDYTGCDNIENKESCYAGCSTNSFYRGTKTSIMKNYDEADDYEAVNENALKKNLGVYE